MKKLPVTEAVMERMKEYDLDVICREQAGHPECFHYDAGEMILSEGRPIPYLYFMLRGKAKVCTIAENGRDLVLCHYLSEGVLGDIELMLHLDCATTSVVALTELECVALPMKQYSEILRGDVVFLNRIGRELSGKLLRSSKSCVNEALHSARERLGLYILETSGNGVFREPLTDTACSIGTSYRHLLRMLRGLCEEGILQKTAAGYVIADRDKLYHAPANFGVGEGL